MQRAGLHDLDHVIHMHQSQPSTSSIFERSFCRTVPASLHSIGERGNRILSSVVGKLSMLTSHFSQYSFSISDFLYNLTFLRPEAYSYFFLAEKTPEKLTQDGESRN